MTGFVQDIEGLAIENNEFHRVLYTAVPCQLVLMALKPQDEIGAEVHTLDQFFRVEEGTGEAVLDGPDGHSGGLYGARPCGRDAQHHQHRPGA